MSATRTCRSSGVLRAFASALNVSEDYLLAADEIVLDGVEFRKKEIASKREQAFVQGQTLHLWNATLRSSRRSVFRASTGTARVKDLSSQGSR